MLGGNQQMPKTLTAAEMEEKTKNRFENPVSGVSAPSWKPEAVKAEKAEIAAEEAAAKAAEKLKADTAEVTPRGSGTQGLSKKKGKSRSRGGRGR
tara:strand:+ start:291 stop:575 length:285 start_codon:yes stop_codon:yes gene_type:complete